MVPIVNTCLKVSGIKEIVGDLAVAGKQKFKITPCSLLFFVCETDKNVGKPQKEAQEISSGVSQEYVALGHYHLYPSSHPPLQSQQVSKALSVSARSCLTYTPYS